METDRLSAEQEAEKRPVDVLQQFVGVFAGKGWLNQTIRIKHRGRTYRISCSDRQFMAYRISDDGSGSQGFPGWAVCIVDHEQIIEDPGMSAFATTELGAHDWLHCIASDGFELIQRQ